MNVSRRLAVGLALVSIAATFGEGGGSPGGLVLWHGGVVALVVTVLARPRADPGSARSVPPGAACAFAAFLLAVGAGALRAPYAYSAWLQGLELACWLAVAWIAVIVGPRLVTTLAPAALAAAGLQGCYAIAQWWVAPGRRPAGTFLNPNHLALWIVATLLVGTGVAAVETGRRARWALALAAPPAVAALALAGSRGALLGLLAGGGCWGLLRWRTLPRRWRAGLGLAALALLGVVGASQVERARELDPFRYQRWRIWRSSLAAFAADPLWGTGPGQFAIAATALQVADREGPLRHDRAFTTTHSDLVRLPAELGAPAALALLAAGVLAARSVARRRRRGDLPEFADGALAALVAVAAHALVDNPSTWPAIYVLVAALLGAVVSVSGLRSRGLGAARRLVAAAVVVAIFGIGDVGPYAAWRSARGLPRGWLTDEQRTRLERAARLNPLHPLYRLLLAEHLSGDPRGWDLNAYAGAREAAEHAERLSPRSAEIARGVARVEALACRTLTPDEACRQRARERYERAASLAPTDPSIPCELAAFLLAAGDPAGARRWAERALDLEPESVLPRLLLADALIDTGSEEARRSARRLLDEAADRAERWAAWRRSPYGRQLLDRPASAVARLEGKLGRGHRGTPGE